MQSAKSLNQSRNFQIFIPFDNNSNPLPGSPRHPKTRPPSANWKQRESNRGLSQAPTATCRETAARQESIRVTKKRLKSPLYGTQYGTVCHARRPERKRITMNKSLILMQLTDNSAIPSPAERTPELPKPCHSVPYHYLTDRQQITYKNGTLGAFRIGGLSHRTCTPAQNP